MTRPDLAAAPYRLRAALSALGAVVLALFYVSGSSAKGEPSPVQFCGTSRCVTFAKKQAGFPDFYSAAYGRGAPAPEQPLPTPFYRVRLLQQGSTPILGYYLPNRAMLEMDHTGGGFALVPARTAAFLAEGLRGVAPFPRPRIKWLFIDGRRVRDRWLQAALFAPYAPARLSSTAGRWIEIGIGWVSVNPWFMEPALSYHVGSRTLLRLGRALQIPPGMARRIVGAAG